jgi:hypothetical protein
MAPQQSTINLRWDSRKKSSIVNRVEVDKGLRDDVSGEGGVVKDATYEV